MDATSPEPAVVENEAFPPEEMSSVDDPTTLDILEILDNEDTLDRLDTLDTPDNLEIPDSTDTADVLDELTACFGSRGLAERFYVLASQRDTRRQSPGL